MRLRPLSSAHTSTDATSMFALTVAASAGARVAPTAGESTHLIPQAPVTGAPPARIVPGFRISLSDNVSMRLRRRLPILHSPPL